MENRIAIIGTREPDTMQEATAFQLAEILTKAHDFHVRTGAAKGVDQAAMAGADPIMLEVVLPWKRYNRDIIPQGTTVIIADILVNPEWYASVDTLHPCPSRLNRQARHLHARNYGIVKPCRLVVALPNRYGGGGTAQGVRIARSLSIPVIQAEYGAIHVPKDVIDRVLAFLEPKK